MKKVLLLGDSIRLGYQPLVKEKLEGVAEVVGPDENGRFAKYTLWYIDRWINQLGEPDLIHWNNGIWDIAHLNWESGTFTSLEEYMATIRKMVRRLRMTRAEIVWATTTAVNPKKELKYNEDIDRFNAAAVSYMKSENIAVNDLNRVIKQNIEAYLEWDYLHLTGEGNEACASAVVAALQKYL